MTRADVDVDYKSSGFPKALVNGHLSSSNSDVRAGRNDEIHNSQWRGLNNWWRNLLSLPRETKKDVYAEAGGSTADARAQASMKPADAVHDLLNTWLVERKPENVISYFAQQSFACADLEAGEKLDRGMAPFRLLMGLQQANQRFGNVSQLGEILTAVPPAHKGLRTKLVQHQYQGSSRCTTFERMRPSSSVASTAWMQLRHRRRLRHPSHLANTMGQCSVSGRRMRRRQ